MSPPSLRGKVPTISPELEHVVMTALEKDPHKRFGNVQAFAAALEQASQSAQLHSLSDSQVITVPSPSQPLQAPVTPPGQSQQHISIPDAPGKPDEPHCLEVSCRAVVLGLGLAGLFIVGGGISWFVLSHGPKPPTMVSTSTPSPAPTPTLPPTSTPTPTPTLIPPGTLL